MKREMGHRFRLGVRTLSIGLVVLWAGAGWGQPNRSSVELRRHALTIAPVASQALRFQKSVIREIAPKLDQSDQKKLDEMTAKLQETLDQLAEQISILQHNNETLQTQLEEHRNGLATLGAANGQLSQEVEQLRKTNVGLVQLNQGLEESTGQLKGQLKTVRAEFFGSLGAFILAVLEIGRRYFATKQLRLQVQQLQLQVGQA